MAVRLTSLRYPISLLRYDTINSSQDSNILSLNQMVTCLTRWFSLTALVTNPENYWFELITIPDSAVKYYFRGY